MNQTVSFETTENSIVSTKRDLTLLRVFFAGILLPFGFAPFHLPGLAILGITLLFSTLRKQTERPFLIGLIFGCGYFSLGISWIFVSINQYGHLNIILSGLITCVFVLYLALYFGSMSMLYSKLAHNLSLLNSGLLFSALWCITEYCRATFCTGFPWLQLAFGQIDAPFKFLLPIIGVYGVGFLACFAATVLAGTLITKKHRVLWLTAFLTIMLAPLLLQNTEWVKVSAKSIPVGVIQANISMHDKWDENVFWKLIDYYKKQMTELLKTQKLIVLPEAAIPLPPSYISDFLDDFHARAELMHSAILLGAPEPTTADEKAYFNTLITLGDAKGQYRKQHLVPFGEFIPKPFTSIMNWLELPLANMQAGRAQQEAIVFQNHPIASLICYELAYPELLRQQLPNAEWIISVSDDGWFGHSLAMYQQQQMAQVLSMLSGRYHIVANNDGLSSIIDNKGAIISEVPSFSCGNATAEIHAVSGYTPWSYFGDWPILFTCFFIILCAIARLLWQDT